MLCSRACHLANAPPHPISSFEHFLHILPSQMGPMDTSRCLMPVSANAVNRAVAPAPVTSCKRITSCPLRAPLGTLLAACEVLHKILMKCCSSTAVQTLPYNTAAISLKEQHSLPEHRWHFEKNTNLADAPATCWTESSILHSNSDFAHAVLGVVRGLQTAVRHDMLMRAMVPMLLTDRHQSPARQYNRQRPQHERHFNSLAYTFHHHDCTVVSFPFHHHCMMLSYSMHDHRTLLSYPLIVPDPVCRWVPLLNEPWAVGISVRVLQLCL